MPDSAPTRFDPQMASQEEWARFHAFRRKRHAETREGDPVDSDRLAELDLRRRDPESMTDHLWTDDGAEVSAVASFHSPRPGAAGYESNRGLL